MQRGARAVLFLGLTLASFHSRAGDVRSDEAAVENLQPGLKACLALGAVDLDGGSALESLACAKACCPPLFPTGKGLALCLVETVEGVGPCMCDGQCCNGPDGTQAGEISSPDAGEHAAGGAGPLAQGHKPSHAP